MLHVTKPSEQLTLKTDFQISYHLWTINTTYRKIVCLDLYYAHKMVSSFPYIVRSGMSGVKRRRPYTIKCSSLWKPFGELSSKICKKCTIFIHGLIWQSLYRLFFMYSSVIQKYRIVSKSVKDIHISTLLNFFSLVFSGRYILSFQNIWAPTYIT